MTKIIKKVKKAVKEVKKVVKVKVVKPTVKPVTKPIEAPVVPTPEEPTKIVVDGSEVVATLKENETARLYKLANGTTAWVSK